MKPVKCLVINGWHKGHQVVLPEALLNLRLPRPAVTTVCNCSYDREVFEAAPNVDEYRLAFTSIDREVAIYTVDGSSRPMIDNRDWLTWPNDKPWKDSPITVNCHDPQAIFEDSKGELSEANHAT